MKVRFIKEYFANRPDSEDVIAYWWDKEDAEWNARNDKLKPKLTHEQWLSVVESMEGASYESDVVDAISAFIRVMVEESDKDK